MKLIGEKTCCIAAARRKVSFCVIIVESTDEKRVLIEITVSAGSSALDKMREAKETAECQVLNFECLLGSSIFTSRYD